MDRSLLIGTGSMLSITCALLGSTPALSEAGVTPLAEVAAAYGLTAEQVERMRSGKVVGGELEAVSDNELALSFAFLSEHSVAWHEERLDRGESSDPTILDRGELTVTRFSDLF